MPDPVADYLRTLNTSDRARAAAWDAAYATDDADAAERLRALPFGNDVRAALWDLRQGGALEGTPTDPVQPTNDQFTEAPAQPEGSATGRFLSNAGAMLNPITAAQGIYNAVRHPLDTGAAILQAQGEQFGKAGDAFREGRYSEAIGHGAAGVVPLVGPAAAAAGEQIGSGDVAGGLGAAAGMLIPVGAPAALRGAVRGTRAVMSPTARAAAATSLEQSAAGRVADVISPKVGANKTRFGNKAEGVAPQLAKDLAEDGAPWTREGFHAQVGERLTAAEQGLDAASDARLSARTFETKPLIDALLEKRRALTAEAVEGSRPIPTVHGPGGVPTPSGMTRNVSSGQMQRTLTKEGRPLGEDVVPGPNAGRVAVLDQAIDELRQLGPVTRYEPIRRIRQSYDGPAKAVYSPSMTADYLKAQGGKLGAADVTGTLRDTLAKWDPETAAANADYSLYRTADDVLEATREVERTRPRVGRVIAARVFGTVTGGQLGGAAGAAMGYVGAPLLDAGAAMGLTTKLKIAGLQQQLANAIRGGHVEHAMSLTEKLARLAKSPRTQATAGVLIEQANTAPTAAERREGQGPARALR